VSVCAVLICKVCKSDRELVLLGDSSRNKIKGNVHPWKPASPVNSSLCVVQVCKL
jgi:hypothetical protein